jgi:rare lipoprotein A
MLRRLVLLLSVAMIALFLASPGMAQAVEGEAFSCEASWYGPGFYGNLTASGDVYTGEAGTAAHPSLPFGTLLYVENLKDGANGYVEITDRGPYAYGRCLDVSAGSSYLVDESVAPVYVEIVYQPSFLDYL